MSDELITTAPVENPRITVDRDGDEMTIHIEGRSKFRLPAAAVTGLIVWAFAAFICPGVFLVTALLAPIALIVLAVLYFVRPEVLKKEMETETILINREEILFSRRYPTSYEDGESQDTSLALRKLDSVELCAADDEEDTPSKLLFIDDDGEHHLVGTCLPTVDDSEDIEKDPNQIELAWLADVINEHIETLRDVELDFASLCEQVDNEDNEDDEDSEDVVIESETTSTPA